MRHSVTLCEAWSNSVDKPPKKGARARVLLRYAPLRHAGVLSVWQSAAASPGWQLSQLFSPPLHFFACNLMAKGLCLHRGWYYGPSGRATGNRHRVFEAASQLACAISAVSRHDGTKRRRRAPQGKRLDCRSPQ